MKYANKKQIQKLYREQIQQKKKQQTIFIETLIIMIIVGIIIAISHFIG